MTAFPPLPGRLLWLFHCVCSIFIFCPYVSEVPGRFISISFSLRNSFCPTGRSWKNTLENPCTPFPQIPQLSASPFHSFRSFSVSVCFLCRNLGHHDIKMGVFPASASQSGVSVDYVPNQFTEPMKISPLVETVSFIQDPMLHLIVLSHQRSSIWNSCSCTREVHPGLESSLRHTGDPRCLPGLVMLMSLPHHLVHLVSHFSFMFRAVCGAEF